MSSPIQTEAPEGNPVDHTPALSQHAPLLDRQQAHGVIAASAVMNPSEAASYHHTGSSQSMHPLPVSVHLSVGLHGISSAQQQPLGYWISSPCKAMTADAFIPSPSTPAAHCNTFPQPAGMMGINQHSQLNVGEALALLGTDTSCSGCGSGASPQPWQCREQPYQQHASAGSDCLHNAAQPLQKHSLSTSCDVPTSAQETAPAAPTFLAMQPVRESTLLRSSRARQSRPIQLGSALKKFGALTHPVLSGTGGGMPMMRRSPLSSPRLQHVAPGSPCSPWSVIPSRFPNHSHSKLISTSLLGNPTEQLYLLPIVLGSGPETDGHQRPQQQRPRTPRHTSTTDETATSVLGATGTCPARFMDIEESGTLAEQQCMNVTARASQLPVQLPQQSLLHGPHTGVTAWYADLSTYQLQQKQHPLHQQHQSMCEEQSLYQHSPEHLLQAQDSWYAHLQSQASDAATSKHAANVSSQPLSRQTSRMLFPVRSAHSTISPGNLETDMPACTASTLVQDATAADQIASLSCFDRGGSSTEVQDTSVVGASSGPRNYPRTDCEFPSPPAPYTIASSSRVVINDARAVAVAQLLQSKPPGLVIGAGAELANLRAISCKRQYVTNHASLRPAPHGIAASKLADRMSSPTLLDLAPHSADYGNLLPRQSVSEHALHCDETLSAKADQPGPSVADVLSNSGLDLRLGMESLQSMHAFKYHPVTLQTTSQSGVARRMLLAESPTKSLPHPASHSRQVDTPCVTMHRTVAACGTGFQSSQEHESSYMHSVHQYSSTQHHPRSREDVTPAAGTFLQHPPDSTIGPLKSACTGPVKRTGQQQRLGQVGSGPVGNIAACSEGDAEHKPTTADAGNASVANVPPSDLQLHHSKKPDSASSKAGKQKRLRFDADQKLSVPASISQPGPDKFGASITHTSCRGKPGTYMTKSGGFQDALGKGSTGTHHASNQQAVASVGRQSWFPAELQLTCGMISNRSQDTDMLCEHESEDAFRTTAHGSTVTANAAAVVAAEVQGARSRLKKEGSITTAPASTEHGLTSDTTELDMVDEREEKVAVKVKTKVRLLNYKLLL